LKSSIGLTRTALTRIEDVEKPDKLVFDLDPDEGLAFKDVVSAAFHLQYMLAQMGLVTFPMVTGGKGVDVIAPLPPSAEWPQVKDFAHRFSTALSQADPDRFTAALAKVKRTDKVFIDYLRNQRGATAVMPYCARSRPFALIAVPISWEELRTLDSPDQWHIGNASEMVKRAASKDLAYWGRADQILPDLGSGAAKDVLYRRTGALPSLTQELADAVARSLTFSLRSDSKNVRPPFISKEPSWPIASPCKIRATNIPSRLSPSSPSPPPA
jgi:DNA primase